MQPVGASVSQAVTLSFAPRLPSTGTVGTVGVATKSGTGPFTDDRPRQARVCCSLRERPCRGDAGGIRRRTPSGYPAPWSTGGSNDHPCRRGRGVLPGSVGGGAFAGGIPRRAGVRWGRRPAAVRGAAARPCRLGLAVAVHVGHRGVPKDARIAPVPIIIVSALDTEADIVRGLELGAEDYISKPFRLRELVARIRSVLRRVTAPPHAFPVVVQAEPSRADVLVVGPFHVNLARRVVTAQGQAIHSVSSRVRPFGLVAITAWTGAHARGADRPAVVRS